MRWYPTLPALFSYHRPGWKGVLLAFFLCTFLNACDNPTLGISTPFLGKDCVEADNFGDKITVKTVVPAAGQIVSDDAGQAREPEFAEGWTRTNVRIVQGAPLKIKSTGVVNLCPDSSSEVTVTPDAKNSSWKRVCSNNTAVPTCPAGTTQVGITAHNLLKITIKTNTRYSEWNYKGDWLGRHKRGRGCPDYHPTNHPWYNDDCWSYSGRGLFVYISDTAPTNTTWSNPDPTVNPQFFELFDYNTQQGGYLGYPTVSGKLWVHYAESNDARNLDGTLKSTQQVTVNYCTLHGKPVYEGEQDEVAVSYCTDDQNVNIFEDDPTYQTVCLNATPAKTIQTAEYFFDPDCEGQTLSSASRTIPGKTPFQGKYSNNPPDDYTLTISTGCTGAFGAYMLGSIGDENGPSDTVINLHERSHIGLGAEQGVYEANAEKDGFLWLKVIDDAEYQWAASPGKNGDGKYIDPKNTGSYTVTIETVKVKSRLSSFMNAIITPIKTEFLQGSDGNYSIAEAMFRRLVGDNPNSAFARAPTVITTTISLLLSLYIIIYAMRFMLGMIQETHSDFIYKLLRTSIVIAVLQPASWEFFHTYLFSVFIYGTEDLIALMTGQFTTTIGSAYDPNLPSGVATLGPTADNPFAFVDQTIDRFMGIETIIKLTALLASGPVGFIYFLLIVVGASIFIAGILFALVLYLISLVGIALLLATAPIFIMLLLFDQTRGFFDNWLKMLANFFLQPVLLFVNLSIFNIFIYSAFYTLMSYQVCWDCVVDLSFTIPTGSIGGGIPDIKIPLGCLAWYLPSSYHGVEQIPTDLFTIFIFIILAQGMISMMMWLSSMAAELTTGQSGASLISMAGGGIIGSSLKTTLSATKPARQIGAAAVKGAGQAGISAAKSLISRKRK